MAGSIRSQLSPLSVRCTVLNVSLQNLFEEGKATGCWLRMSQMLQDASLECHKCKRLKKVTVFSEVQSVLKIWIISSRCSSGLQGPSTNKSEAYFPLASNSHGNCPVEHNLLAPSAEQVPGTEHSVMYPNHSISWCEVVLFCNQLV